MACPSCGGALGAPIPYPGAQRWQEARFAADRILFCIQCGLGAADPLPAQAALDAFYSGGGYWHAVPDGASQSAHARNQCRHRARHAMQARSHRGRLRVLDVGAGEAWLGEQLAPAAYDFVEPDPRLRERAARRLGDRARAFATLDDVGGGYDLVFVNQVLEHVADPGALLTGMAARLATAGALYLEVPHADYRFKADVFPHTLFFTPESLVRVAERAGLATLACEAFGCTPESRPAPARLAGKIALKLGAAVGLTPLANAGDDLLFGYAARADGIWLRWLGRRAGYA